MALFSSSAKTSLSGPGSRRRLGTQSGAMSREARRLERDGYGKAAEGVAMAASEQRLKEGSAISTQAETLRERDLMRARDRGLMQQQRNSVLRPESVDATGAIAPPQGATTAASGDQLAQRKNLYERMRGGVTPEMRTEATKLGITDSGFARASASASQNPISAPAAGVTQGRTLSRPVSRIYDSDNNGIPNSLQRPDPIAPSTTPREGRINGMPASQAITAVGKPAQFGKEFATRNLQTLGLSGAIADYRRREAEAGKPAEPGNMAEIRARDTVGPTGTPFGPLQSYLNQTIADREERAADSAAVEKITKGLNTSPTPNLTQGLTQPPSSQLGPVAQGRSLARPTPISPVTTDSGNPAPALARPTAPRTTGRLNVKFFGPEGYVDPKHAAKVAEMEKAKKAREEKNRINMGKGTTKQPAMDRIFGKKPLLFEGDSFAGRYYDALNK